MTPNLDGGIMLDTREILHETVIGRKKVDSPKLWGLGNPVEGFCRVP